MAIINTVLFEAEWENPYEKEDISEHKFKNSSGMEQETEFMSSVEYRYIEADNVTGFIKPYKNGQYSFVAMLPQEGITPEEYVRSLTWKELCNMVLLSEERTVETLLPKFKYEYGIEMDEAFKALGIKSAFDADKADFTSLGTSSLGNIFINRVLHKTYIQVDEKGTRAGAASSFFGAKSAAPGEELKRVILDRPFFYMIIENQTGIPIFMGILNEV